MSKKAAVILFLFFFTVLLIYSENKRVYPLEDLSQPYLLTVHNGYLYITDGVNGSDEIVLKRFSLKDFKYNKTIGKTGPGPGEYTGFLFPAFLPDTIFISSSHKISYFDYDGKFIKERRYPKFGTLKPVKDNYLSWKFERIENNPQVCYDLLDSEFKLMKRLYCGNYIRRKNRKRDVFEISFYDTYKDKIVLAQREGFVIDIFNSDGSLINTIRQNYKPIPFTEKDKAAVINYWKITPPYNSKVDYFKQISIFPKYYPPILTCKLSDDKIFVVTYAKNKDGNEILVFSLTGKYIGKRFLPIIMNSPSEVSPFTIHNNYLYQIVENYEKEVWELHVLTIQ